MLLDFRGSTVDELYRGYSRGDFSPVEVLDWTLAEAEASRGSLNAFSAIDLTGARDQAAQSAERWRRKEHLGSLDGIPVSVKDNVAVSGMPTRFGSRAIASSESAMPDSPSVASLRRQGAVLFAKTTMSDHAHKLLTDSPLTGVTRNPWNLGHTPGGSSGGAAAALAGGIGPVSVGTDGGGSIRVPAAWCGLYGIKPSFGRVPHAPRGVFGPLSHVGPMARTVADAAYLLDGMIEADPQDWYSLPMGGGGYHKSLRPDFKGLRVAVAKTLGRPDLRIAPELLAAVDRCAQVAQENGAIVEEAEPPAMADLNRVSAVYWPAFAAALVKRLGHLSAELDPSLLELARQADGFDLQGMVEAMTLRANAGGEVNRFFQRYDILLCPVIDTFAPSIPVSDPTRPPVPTLTTWCNATGQPSASIPAGLGSNGLPIGVQVVGRQYDDQTVLNVSLAFERHFGVQPLPDRSIWSASASTRQ